MDRGGMMPNTIRDILLNYQMWVKMVDSEYAIDTNQALSSIHKLILEAVGKDREYVTEHTIRNHEITNGYNQAKAEIREKLKEIM
jgi:hypothetical protein